jgi:uncharacterized membrane protein YhaH (DUF805 family)
MGSLIIVVAAKISGFIGICALAASLLLFIIGLVFKHHNNEKAQNTIATIALPAHSLCYICIVIFISMRITHWLYSFAPWLGWIAIAITALYAIHSIGTWCFTALYAVAIIFKKYYILAFKKYAVFSGRTRRIEFWTFTIFNGIIFIVCDRLAEYSFNTWGERSIAEAVFNVFSLVYGFTIIIPQFSIAVRRFHDTNVSGWWIIPITALLYVGDFFSLWYVAIAGSLVWLILLIRKGTVGSNKYGDDPKANELDNIYYEVGEENHES